MRKLLLIFLPLTSLFAQIPSYYNGIDLSQSGTQLMNQLANLVTATHTTELLYTPDVWTALKQTDLDPENPQKVFLIYGQDDSNPDPKYHRTRDKDLSCHSNSCAGLWVREHVFPKSLANPSFDVEGPGSDAHAIRAVDSQLNNVRSNRKFVDGEGYSHIDNNGNFYPGDEWKGDVARMMMYMHIRYGSRCRAYFVGTGSHTFSDDMPDIFLKWNAEDPVSEHEWVRNQVLEEMQGNRNPFIDNPYLATKIWGGYEAENTWEGMSTYDLEKVKTEIYPNPTADYLYISSNKKIQQISVYTITGNTIFSKVKFENKPLQISHLENGTYFLLIYYADQTKESKKFQVKK